MQKGVIFDIKRYAIHDGPGIRTTVFMKGCPFSCIWCHNPESLAPQPQTLYTRQRCIGCGECMAACPEDALTLTHGGPVADSTRCRQCGICARACPAEARETAGRYERVEHLVEMIEKDILFTEFMEQRAPGHTTLDGTIYRKGMQDLKKEITAALAGLDTLNDAQATGKAEQLNNHPAPPKVGVTARESGTCHVYFGKLLGASTNGRFAGQPQSDGTSPSHGADRNGPTAVIKSLSKMDQIKN